MNISHIRMNSNYFSDKILSWDKRSNTREMPWKREKDPYKIWISEIILQQTRVAQGLDYYKKFIKTFPNVKRLAEAHDDAVYKLWEGLGYYTRCKNLMASAKFIHHNLDGKFPARYQDILNLKGIGPYTAAAIASFAYNLPFAVLDGNVFRVLSRFFGVEIPVNTNEGKKFYSDLAQQLLDKKNPARYNQAIMDFGAVICKPQNPLCNECPLQQKCMALKSNKVNLLPINNKKTLVKERVFNYFIVHFNGGFYVRKREGKDIWQNLFEFILIEGNLPAEKKRLLKNKKISGILANNEFTLEQVSEWRSQRLTHQLIKGRFFHLEINSPLNMPEKYILITKPLLKNLPFPKFIAAYLAEKNVSLRLI